MKFMKYLLWQAVPGFIWFLVISSKISPERLASGILNDRVLWFEMIPGFFYHWFRWMMGLSCQAVSFLLNMFLPF